MSTLGSDSSALIFWKESIFYLGTTNFLGGSFFIKNHKNLTGGIPPCQKSGVFGQKPAFLEASII